MVAVERSYEDPEGVSSLLVDSEKGAFTATRHLIERGYRRIAMIGGPLEGPGSTTYARAQRFEGYRRALTEAGRVPDPKLVVAGNFRLEGGRDAMQRLLAVDERPDAVFAANDMMALGALHAVREAGLRVPEDVALVGFDDIPMASLTSPGLTTMAMPMRALGEAAAALLKEQVAQQGRQGTVRRIFDAELVVRDSSARR